MHYLCAHLVFLYRFDFFYTLIAYIQSRGRARRKDSKYILLAERGNASQYGMVDEFRGLEADMKTYCQTMPEERNVANKFSIGMHVDYDSDDEPDSDDEDYMGSAIYIAETGATLTKQNAIPLIHRYCSSLPSDSFCVLKPIFETTNTGQGYICKLTLPSNAAIQELESPVARTKDHARALVALNACSQLLTLKAFDNHLMPRNIRKEILGEMAPQYDENGMIIGSRRRHGLYEKRTPKIWNRIVEEEEEEEVGIEDNADLLKAQVQTVVEGTSVVEPRPELNGDTEDNTDSPEIREENVKLVEEVVKSIKEEIIPSQDNVKSSEEAETLTEKTKELQLEYEENGQIMLNLDLVKEYKEEEDVNSVADEADDDADEELEEGPFTCWFTIIEVKLPDRKFEDVPYRRLCLISKRPLPNLPEIKMFHQSVPFMVKMRNLSTEVIFGREQMLRLSDYVMKLMLALINKEFHCPINDIPYYIVPLIKNCEDIEYEKLSGAELEDLVDWQEVDKIIESKNEPFILEESSDPTDTIIIDSSDNSRRYFVTNVRNDMSPNSCVPEGVKIREAGYATFADYYREKGFADITDYNQPLLQVKRLKKVMNFLYPGHIVPAQLKGPLSTWTLPQFCQRFFMSASVYQATMMIPSIMTRVDSLLLCREAKDRYDLPIDDANFLEAYTAPSASMEMNYERLETLGGK